MSTVSYPHLRKFIAHVILPRRLSHSEDTITLFTNDLISLLPKKKGDTVVLFDLIMEISPIPEYCGGCTWDAIKEQIVESGLKNELEEALEKDGFRFKYASSSYESYYDSD
jgi:hypothetical protein